MSMTKRQQHRQDKDELMKLMANLEKAHGIEITTLIQTILPRVLNYICQIEERLEGEVF